MKKTVSGPGQESEWMIFLKLCATCSVCSSSHCIFEGGKLEWKREWQTSTQGLLLLIIKTRLLSLYQKELKWTTLIQPEGTRDYKAGRGGDSEALSVSVMCRDYGIYMPRSHLHTTTGTSANRLLFRCTSWYFESKWNFNHFILGSKLHIRTIALPVQSVHVLTVGSPMFCQCVPGFSPGNFIRGWGWLHTLMWP